MREFRTYGSVRGVPSDGHPYRDNRPFADVRSCGKQTSRRMTAFRYRNDQVYAHTGQSRITMSVGGGNKRCLDPPRATA